MFVPAELRQAVSGEAWLAALLEAERALARAGAEAGIVPGVAAAAIASACLVEGYVWDDLLEQGRDAGTPVEPLVRAIVTRVGEEHSRFVHFGATSQDVMDTAAMLVSRHALGIVLADLSRVDGGDARSSRDVTATRRWWHGRFSSRRCRRRSA